MVDSAGITLSYNTVPNHSPVQRAALISWNAPGGYFQTKGNGTAVDINTYLTLDMRLSRQSSTLNPAGVDTNFYVSLLGDDNNLYGPLNLSDYTSLQGPVGGARGGLHPILQTVRMPLADFGIAVNVAGVRLDFADTATGAIYLANIRFSTLSGFAKSGDRRASIQTPIEDTPQVRDYNEPTNIINSIRSTAYADALGNQAGVEIEMLSTHEFPVRDELAVLRIGDQGFSLSRFADDGDTHALTFMLTNEEYAKIATGDEVTLQYGRGPANERWLFGRLDKSIMNK